MIHSPACLVGAADVVCVGVVGYTHIDPGNVVSSSFPAIPLTVPRLTLLLICSAPSFSTDHGAVGVDVDELVAYGPTISPPPL